MNDSAIDELSFVRPGPAVDEKTGPYLHRLIIRYIATTVHVCRVCHRLMLLVREV